jgi:hypothetical protein
MLEHAVGRRLQGDLVEHERLERGLEALRVAQHLRRLAEDQVEGHVDRALSELRVRDQQAAVGGSGADHCKGTALAFADLAETFDIFF